MNNVQKLEKAIAAVGNNDQISAIKLIEEVLKTIKGKDEKKS